MKRIFAVTLGILTAIGGFLDIGDLVTNAVVGSRFGLGLAWVVPVGVLGICLFAQMSGRVAAVSGRATFEIIRDRVGSAGRAGQPRCVVLRQPDDDHRRNRRRRTGTAARHRYRPDAVDAGRGVWCLAGDMAGQVRDDGERYGLAGLALIVFAVSVFLLHPNWGDLGDQALSPVVPPSESAATYWYFAIALFGAAMTPYEVFFFSSGAVEEGWSDDDLGKSRLNVLVGFPLGGVLSLSIAACSALVFLPKAIEVTSLSQMVAPAVVAGGKLALAFTIVGIVAATFGAALETTLSAGYTIAQFFGWPWGKFRRPTQESRFHVVMMAALVAGCALLFTGVDPIMITEYSVVFSAIPLPLTYLPILLVANDPDYMGDRVNGRATNTLAMVYLVIILAASVAAIPLMIVTGAGQ